MTPSASWSRALAAAIARRGPDITTTSTVYRLCDGRGDDTPGLYLDRYGPAAVLSVYDDAGLDEEAVTTHAREVLEQLTPTGCEAVYVKPFRKDRSRLGGQAPSEATSPTPRAGTPMPDALVVQEHGVKFEARLWDGFSTGLFPEHREHRRALATGGVTRALNLFAYTCGFSVPLALSGAAVTNVDVSARYLEWGKRNHALNGIADEAVRYKRMDSLTYLKWAARQTDERYDLIILDPPTFGAGDKRRGVKPWSAVKDYPALLQAAAAVLIEGGAIFAATNARTLASGDGLRDLIDDVFPRVKWLTLPPWPTDVRERGRVASALFTIR
jgi:23S rRNA (cytosine1962-C5)-methyltransferase